MSSVLKTVTANGDTVDWTLEFTTDPFLKCFNNQVAITIPNGVSLIGPSDPGKTVIKVPVGYYNNTTNIWFLGDLDPALKYSVNLEFRVDDINQKDPNDNRFLIVATASSSCNEVETADDTTTLVIEVVDPCTQVDLSIGTTEAVSAGKSDLSIS